MKVSIDIDCTPEEARRFFGLPDLAPMQAAVMKAMQERLVGNVQAMDAENLLRSWGSMGLQGFDQMQKYWAQFRTGADEGPKGG